MRQLNIPGKSTMRLSPPKRLHLLFTIALVLAISASAAHAFGVHTPQGKEKQQIEKLEQQWRTATLSGDTGTLDKMLAEDFVGISWNGEVSTKAMQIDRIRTRTFALTRLDLTDSKVKLLGRVAIVTSLAQVTGTSDGADMTGTFRYTRVYQRLPNGTWQITNFEATRVPDGTEHRHHDHGQPPPPPAPTQ
jgi:ketosteroid isomerase-like protein